MNGVKHGTFTQETRCLPEGLGSPEGRLLPCAGCTTVGSQETFDWRSERTLERTMAPAVPLRQAIQSEAKLTFTISSKLSAAEWKRPIIRLLCFGGSPHIKNVPAKPR